MGKFGFGVQNEAGQRLIGFCQENTLVIANTLFQQHKRRLYTWTSPDGQHQNLIIFFAAKDGEALYSQQKQENDLCFQGKPFNITLIQVYAPTSNAEEAEGEWFYEDLKTF